MHEEIAKLSWDDKVSICKQWKHSGLSMSKFCAQKKLALATFSGWCVRLWPSRSKTKSNKLCEVTITEPQCVAAAKKPSVTIEVLFPQAVTARIEATGDQIGFLLQELLYATTTAR